jgi:Sigma-70 region 2
MASTQRVRFTVPVASPPLDRIESVSGPPLPRRSRAAVAAVATVEPFEPRCATCGIPAASPPAAHWRNCTRRRTVRQCRGCGEVLGPAYPRGRRYCDGCRAQTCPECDVRAGGHSPRCRYLGRTRQRVRVWQGRTSAEDLSALFTTYHRDAIRAARRAAHLSWAEAEDVVSRVFLQMWARRDYFDTPPGTGYLFTAVKHVALAQRLSGWRRYVVPMDPETLEVTERIAYDPTAGLVRVPL